MKAKDRRLGAAARFLALGAVSIVWFGFAGSARCETEVLNVTTTEDVSDPEDGDLSLREAIAQANTHEERGFASALILLPPGDFFLAVPLDHLTGDDITIRGHRGSSEGTTTIYGTTEYDRISPEVYDSQLAAFWVESSGITIESLEIDGNWAFGVRVTTGSDGMAIQDIELTDLRVHGDTSGETSGVFVGLQVITQGSATSIHDILIVHNEIEGVTHGIQVGADLDAKNTTLEGLEIVGNTIQDSIFTDSHFVEPNKDRGITVGAFGSNARYNTVGGVISGNTIEDGWNGITGWGGAFNERADDPEDGQNRVDLEISHNTMTRVDWPIVLTAGYFSSGNILEAEVHHNLGIDVGDSFLMAHGGQSHPALPWIKPANNRLSFFTHDNTATASHDMSSAEWGAGIGLGGAYSQGNRVDAWLKDNHLVGFRWGITVTDYHPGAVPDCPDPPAECSPNRLDVDLADTTVCDAEMYDLGVLVPFFESSVTMTVDREEMLQEEPYCPDFPLSAWCYDLNSRCD